MNKKYPNRNILIEIHKFYSTLFHKTENKCMKDFFNKINSDSYNQLSKQDADALEGELPEYEISQSLQSIKHNKSPGIDGVSSKFYKVFWKN